MEGQRLPSGRGHPRPWGKWAQPSSWLGPSQEGVSGPGPPPPIDLHLLRGFIRDRWDWEGGRVSIFFLGRERVFVKKRGEGTRSPVSRFPVWVKRGAVLAIRCVKGVGTVTVFPD